MDGKDGEEEEEEKRIRFPLLTWPGTYKIIEIKSKELACCS